MAFAPLLVTGQDRKILKNDDIQQRLEFIAQQTDASNIDYSELLETLSWYYDHPLNLNTATEQQLNSLGFLTPFQVNALMSYRIKYGDLQSIYELRNIPEFDFVTITNLYPFVTVAPSKEKEAFSVKKAFKRGRHEVMAMYSRVFEQQEGYMPADSTTSPNSRYAGDPNRLYLRYRFRWSDRLSIGFTAEKDPGEEFFKGSNPNGFDFYSAHLFITELGPVKQLAVGDFQVRFGQGLTFWSGFAYQKTADALNVIKHPKKLMPYASRNENNFLRGAGVTVGFLKRVELTAFYSQKRIDANIADLDTITGPEARVFTSLQTSGLHRTPSEIADKHAIKEQIAGANLSYRGKQFAIGLTGIRSFYDARFDRNKQFYQKFQLDTNLWYNAGLDFRVVINRFSFFGEGAVSNNGGWGVLAGVLARLNSRFNVTILGRNYQKNYLSVYTKALGEKSVNNNERGIYFGMEATLASRLVLTFYLDFYAFDWLSYRADGPSQGLDFMARLNWKPTRHLNTYLRFRQERKQRNSNMENAIAPLINERKWYLRFHLDYDLSSRVKMSSRVELSNFKTDETSPSKGFLIYQNISYDFMQHKSRLVGLIALFDMDSYDARIYTYENDVLYYFNIPAYYQRGWRAYLMWQWKIAPWVETWLRFSRTFLTNRPNFGTGTERIDAPHRTDIRVQVRFKF